MSATLESVAERRGDPRHAVPATERRRRRWSAGWRAALRLAARDARRHRLASVLIVLMIGLPVMIISAGSALLATKEVTRTESLPVAVGRAQALVADEQAGAVEQTADGDVISMAESPGRTVAGHKPGEPWTTAQVERLTGGIVGITGLTTAFTDRTGTLTRIEALVLGRSVLEPSGLAELVEGRWPAAPGEVAVTEQGLAAGLPSSGPLPLSVSSNSGLARVTGIVRARGPDFGPVDLVIGEDWLPADEVRRFLVVRDQPVVWDDVRSWNSVGLSVISPTVALDPPPGVPTRIAPRNAATVALVVVTCVGLVLETALLAGPAFAVSAARRRRSLALIASNGAEQKQLTRHVLAQGVVLGAIAVAAGSILGTVGGWWGIRLLARLLDRRGSTIGTPPLDTYGWATAIIMAVAFAAALISAAVPGHRAARLDIADTLAGRETTRTSSAGVPVAGAVIVGVGSALVVSSLLSRTLGGLYAAGFGGALMIIGSLLLLPSLLSVLGRGLRRAPAILRVAGRDTTRLRGRTVPAVAAITVVVAVLTMITVSAGSDEVETRRDYRPSAPFGHGRLESYGSPQATLGQIRAQHPTWRIESAGSLGTTEDLSRPVVTLNAVPSGCTVEETIGATTGDKDPVPCQQYRWDSGWSVDVPAPGSLNPAAALTTDQLAALDRGDLLVTSPGLLRNKKVRLAVTDVANEGRDAGGSAAPLKLTRMVEVPAVLISGPQLSALRWSADAGGGPEGGVMLAAGTERAGLPWTVERWDIADPAGPISKADQTEINNHSETPLAVERGYESPLALVLAVLFGVAAALVAVGALISTALTQVESRAEQATLAALGASSGFRRRLAAAQAGLIAVIGTIVGIVLGTGPGLALATSLTTDTPEAAGKYPAPTLVMPWFELALLVLVVPTACALLASLMVARRPPMTRRPT